jgi:hypothetical protein
MSVPKHWLLGDCEIWADQTRQTPNMFNFYLKFDNVVPLNSVWHFTNRFYLYSDEFGWTVIISVKLVQGGTSL